VRTIVQSFPSPSPCPPASFAVCVRERLRRRAGLSGLTVDSRSSRQPAWLSFPHARGSSSRCACSAVGCSSAAPRARRLQSTLKLELTGTGRLPSSMSAINSARPLCAGGTWSARVLGRTRRFSVIGVPEAGVLKGDFERDRARLKPTAQEFAPSPPRPLPAFLSVGAVSREPSSS